MGNLAQTLVSELGLDTLPPEKQEKLLDRIGTIIFQGVMMRTFNLLSDVQKDALEAQLTGAEGSPENTDKIFAFLAANVPNFDSIVEAEIARFKLESLELMNTIA